MKLSTLLSGIDCQIYGNTDIELTGISFDSRKVKAGDVFVALPGYHNDGKEFATEAVSKGAEAVIANQYIDMTGTALVVVRNVREVLAQLSAKLYRHPDRKMSLIGVTGTNGKTTITYFIESIFKSARMQTGVVGTVNYRYGKKISASINTTPESATLYGILDKMVRHRCRVAVLEVSSHALALGRVSGMTFNIGIFTNLTRDHLDFHKTMSEYFDAKAKLFVNFAPKFAIINTDDPWGRKLVKLAARSTVFTYGINKKADIWARGPKVTSRGTEFTLVTRYGSKKVFLYHLGLHNVYNALASAGAALAYGISFNSIVKGLEKASAVPGRLEKVDLGQPYTVVVDYAHTDDALKNVLLALKQLKPKRLITVFGCGGDRDRTKRPLMGEIATKISDFVFVTSDNPRSEDPSAIALDIEVGIRRHHRNNYQVILDREQAIAAAIYMAKKNDIILIAGKGHETYQIVGDQVIHFNDTEISRKYIKKRKS